MTVVDLASLSYQGKQSQVEWHGLHLKGGDAFDAFLSKDVAERLHDAEGAEDFETHLRGLAGTDFARDGLAAILAADIPEERDWAVGEAIAEAHLQQAHNLVWPWNMERDKRTPRASLPGADLVGFQVQGNAIRLALGEVKTSRDPSAPPNVMNGRGGMKHQIDELAHNLGLVARLLKWLQPRCKGTKHQASFDASVTLLLDSGNRAVALFGVLVRDTTQEEQDLRPRAQTLAASLQAPTTCHLIALYLPCTIADLPAHVSRVKS